MEYITFKTHVFSLVYIMREDAKVEIKEKKSRQVSGNIFSPENHKRWKRKSSRVNEANTQWAKEHKIRWHHGWMTKRKQFVIIQKAGMLLMSLYGDMHICRVIFYSATSVQVDYQEHSGESLVFSFCVYGGKGLSYPEPVEYSCSKIAISTCRVTQGPATVRMQSCKG